MTTWKLDTAHTSVTFAVKHMMISTVRGSIADVSGEIVTDGDAFDTARGEIRLGIGSIDTGVEFRDNHLRSADFFDAENHPVATFAIHDVKHDGADGIDLEGELTIRGQARKLPLKAEHLGFFTSMEGKRRVGFQATGRISRKRWGLDWNVALETGGWLVGDEITLTIDAAFEEAEVGALGVAA
jgi:polyisoprenoid-binding protein YceI